MYAYTACKKTRSKGVVLKISILAESSGAEFVMALIPLLSEVSMCIVRSDVSGERRTSKRKVLVK